MFNFLSPIDTVSSLALLVLALFGLVELAIALGHHYYLNKRHLLVLQVERELVSGKLTDFINSLVPPATFEIAIHHLGKDIHYYLVVPRKMARELVSRSGIQEVEDYDLFHHGGEHLGAYLRGDNLRSGIDLEKIDFSRVNEIGEGVVVQMVFGHKRGRRLPVNFRILVSAPSNYQAKEILAAIKPSFPGFNLIETRGNDFISRVNFREFNEEEVVFWELN